MSKLKELIKEANQIYEMRWKVLAFDPEDNKLVHTSDIFDCIDGATKCKIDWKEKHPSHIVEIVAESVRVKTTFGSGKKGLDYTYRDKKDAVDVIDKALDSGKGTKVVATVESSQKNEDKLVQCVVKLKVKDYRNKGLGIYYTPIAIVKDNTNYDIKTDIEKTYKPTNDIRYSLAYHKSGDLKLKNLTNAWGGKYDWDYPNESSQKNEDFYKYIDDVPTREIAKALKELGIKEPYATQKAKIANLLAKRFGLRSVPTPIEMTPVLDALPYFTEESSQKNEALKTLNDFRNFHRDLELFGEIIRKKYSGNKQDALSKVNFIIGLVEEYCDGEEF